MTLRERIDRILDGPASIHSPVIAVVFVTIMRFLLEIAPGRGDVTVQPDQIALRLSYLVHIIGDSGGFYVGTVLGALVMYNLFLGDRPGNLSLASLSLLLGLLPPILDHFIPSLGGGYFDYMFGYQWHFMEQGSQHLGETITVWLSIIGAGLLIGWYTKSPLKGLGAFAYMWAFAFMLGVAIPSFFIADPEFTNVTQGRLKIPFGVLSFTLALWIISRWRQLWPCLIRLIHGLPFVGLSWIASQIAGLSFEQSLYRALVVLGLCFVIVVQNDVYDRAEDELAERAESATLMDVMAVTMLAVSFLVNVARAIPMMALTASGLLLLAVAYHHPAFRLKQNFCLSYLIEGGTALISFATGLMGIVGILPDIDIHWALLLVFGGGALLSIPKDWKDVDSDRAANIPTLYVELTAGGRTVDAVHGRIRLLVTTGVLLGALLLSRLTGWSSYYFALLAGGLVVVSPLWLGKSPKRSTILYIILLGAWLVSAGELVRALGLA